MEVYPKYPKWPLFHRSLIKNCSVYEQWGGSRVWSTSQEGYRGPGGHLTSTYKLNPAFAISTFPIIHFVCVFLASTHANNFECALSSSSLGTFNRPDRNVNNAYAKLLASVGGQETRKQSGNVEMANCPGTKLNTHPHPYPNPSHHFSRKHASNHRPWILRQKGLARCSFFLFFYIYSRE